MGKEGSGRRLNDRQLNKNDENDQQEGLFNRQGLSRLVKACK